MGKVALVVFLASLALAPLSLVMVVVAAARIFRTVKYARKDFQSYQRLFSERLERLEASRDRVVERISRVGEEFREAGENLEEAREALEELAHPTLGSLLRSFSPRD